MTKSSDACEVNEPNRCIFYNLHDFLRTKRRIVKFAKRTKPGNIIVKKRGGSGLVSLAKNRALSRLYPNLPIEIFLKSSSMEFSPLQDHVTLRFGSNGLPRLVRDIVHGLYCNANNINIHCDMKPRNFLLLPGARAIDSDSCSVDFESAKEFEIRGRPADIWAFGCSVLEMLTRKPEWGFGNRYEHLLDYYNDN